MLGGYLTDNYSWPWIFFVNVPIGIISAGIVAAFLTDSKHKVGSIKVDFIGIALLAVGLGALQYVLEEGNQKDWFQDSTIARFKRRRRGCLVARCWRGSCGPAITRPSSISAF